MLRGFLPLLGLISMVVILALSYLRNRREAIRHLRANSQMIQTSRGDVEYAVAGEGYPVIILHGMGGGYEQGLLVGTLFDLSQYRMLAITRPGYRRTPLTTGRTFEEQADAIAEVLERLNIASAAVLGLSGGGLAAIQFAMRHPRRCRSLVLLSAHGPATLDFLPDRKLLWLFKGLVFADFLIWMILKLPIKIVFGLEGSSLRHFEVPEKLNLAQRFLQGVFPATDWKTGTHNDIEQLFELEEKPEWLLETIAVPTLILHRKRDQIVRFESAQRHAQRIPNAKLIAFEEGTHLAFVTHGSDVSHCLEEFLK